MRRARRRDVYWSTWAPVERGTSGSATCGARRGATVASLARALCAEAHKPWPNAAGERHSATTPLAADVAVGRRHSNRVTDEDAQVMTKKARAPKRNADLQVNPQKQTASRAPSSRLPVRIMQQWSCPWGRR